MKLSQPELERILAKGHVRIASITPARTRAPMPARSAASVDAFQTARKGPTPHDILWDLVRRSHGAAALRESPTGVPGRKFRADIAMPECALIVEVDGWEWHGKHKNDFANDRLRQNLLTECGWRILRFSAGHIRQQIDAVGASILSAAQQSAPCIGGPAQVAHGARVLQQALAANPEGIDAATGGKITGLASTFVSSLLHSLVESGMATRNRRASRAPWVYMPVTR